MRKLVLKMSMSLDGFVSGADGSVEWIFQGQDEAATRWTVATISDASLHIMGSRTFYDMAAYWPTSKEIYAPPMNDIPKAVFTRKGLDPARAGTTAALAQRNRANAAAGVVAAVPSAAIEESWRHPYVAAGDMAGELTRLKAQDGRPIVAHGGAGFARSLIATGLVDEYALLIHPVILGKGLPIFTDVEAPRRLALAAIIPFPGGAAAHIYRAA